MTDHAVNDDSNVILVPKQLVKQVRRYVQDYAEVNTIFDGEEVSDTTIARFLVDEVDTWNYTPPIIAQAMINPISLVAVEALAGVRRWIVDATAARAMKSVVIKLARNDMPYTAGNVTVQPASVWRNLQPIIQDIELQYKEFRQNYKMAKNAEAAYGSTHSELYVGIYDNREGYVVITP